MAGVLAPLVWLLTLAPLVEGDVAPAGLDVVTLDGRRARIELRDQVTVIEFFATWCPRCRESVAGYRKLAAEYGDRVRFVIIDVEEPSAAVARFFAKQRLSGILIVRDPDGRVIAAFGPKSYPSSLLIDATGIVRDVSRGWGAESTAELAESIEKVLRKPKARPVVEKKKRAPAPPPPKSSDDHARDLGVEVLR